jgi:hypothetical protein
MLIKLLSFTPRPVHANSNVNEGEIQKSRCGRRARTAKHTGTSKQYNKDTFCEEGVHFPKIHAKSPAFVCAI